MTEQEVQWGEWTEGHDRPIRSRPHEDGGVVVQSVSAAYLNALEREVRELRAYKVLADEIYEAYVVATTLSMHYQAPVKGEGK